MFLLFYPVFNSFSLVVSHNTLRAWTALVVRIAILLALHIHNIGEQSLHVALAKAPDSLVFSLLRRIKHYIVASLIATHFIPPKVL
jgi:hypothetical protein